MTTCRVELQPAARVVVSNLMQPYLHDLSSYAEMELLADGTFALIRYFDAYWEEPQRHPFVIICDGELAGFVLVRQIGPNAHSIGEFFVLRAHRRSGCGRAAAHAAFRRFGGRWHVAQDADNLPAQAFWRRVIGEFTDGQFEDGWSDAQPRGPQQRFRSAGAVADLP